MSPLSFAVLAYGLVASPEVSPRAVPLEPWAKAVLGKEDKKLLDSLFKDLLFDPKNALRVEVKVPAYQIPATSHFRYSIGSLQHKVTAEGWLVRGKRGESDRIYFIDGESIPVPAGKMTPVDFVGQCKQRYCKNPVQNQLVLDDEPELGKCDLTRAAWLHRIGFDGLAALALKARSHEKASEELRTDFARRAFYSAIQAYCARADEEAIHHFDRLHRVYPDIVRDAYPQLEPILVDLKRRKAAGTFGKQPVKDWPNGFATWDVKRRIEHIIASLDEIDGTQPELERDDWGSRDNFTCDRRYQALIEIGDTAIPALIQAIESDERLIRFPELGVVHRDRIDHCPILSVRDVAHQAVSDILQMREFAPEGSQRESSAPPLVLAARIRKYWTTYGHLPFVERMMTILIDRTAKPEVRREAARNLARENSRLYSADRYHRQSWHRERWRDSGLGLTPMVLKFKSPTVAEAILAAMNDAIEELKEKDDGLRSWHRNEEDVYVDYLVELGDYRVVGELARRAATAQTIWQRLRYARACQSMGANAPLIQVARELTTGTIWWSRAPFDENTRDTANNGLDLVLSELNGATFPEANAALFAVTDIHHPCYAMVVNRVLNGRRKRFGSHWLSNHAICLEVLRKCLKNQELTGTQFFLRGDEIQSLSAGGDSSKSPISAHPASSEWFERVDERLADRAAEAIANRLIGVPLSSPLRKDRDLVLRRIDETILRYSPRWRELDFEQNLRFTGWPRRYGNGLDSIAFHCSFSRHSPPPPASPDIEPLKRPATREDVRAGRAVFELSGKGMVAEAKLPAWLLLKSEAKQKAPSFGLVVQAEIGSDGKLIYGVIFRNEIRAVKAEQVERIEAFEKK